MAGYFFLQGHLDNFECVFSSEERRLMQILKLEDNRIKLAMVISTLQASANKVLKVLQRDNKVRFIYLS
ncbi:hypothetical protein A9R04_00615 [Nocardiopsis dassonvillei]|nr:hypothetical protein A9R04_00615 [Nocardiopsis dassonvillei]